jgi:acyl-CoA synthetase (AMP-forming)/AMP-acid ligase II
VFGTALAGGVATTLSTFSTQAELEHMLQLSAASVLLLERNVLKKDFAEMVAALEPAIATAEPGRLAAAKLPFLRHIASVGGGSGAIEDWQAFLSRGRDVAPELVEATAATVRPADPGVVFFSSGSTARPKGWCCNRPSSPKRRWR